jgi:pyruvate, water dikinase
VRADAAIVPFSELPAEATALAGGKGASLARMAASGLPVPPGFVVCAAAFQTFLDAHGGTSLVRELTNNLDVHDASALDDVASRLRALITGSALPPDLRGAMGQAYEDLGLQPAVAVRSSAVSEDGEAASFAGQQETFLNVRGEEAVARQVQACWASFFAPRALFYRAKKGALSDTRMAVVVQEMVRADRSGVLFTIDPIRKRRDRMVIEAVFGLGEGIVSGEITPDHYVLDHETGSVLEEFIAVQPMAVMYDPQLEGTRHIELTEDEGAARVLDAGQLGRLHSMGLRVEAFFGVPQDVEWSFRDSELFLLQSRPVTTL